MCTLAWPAHAEPTAQAALDHARELQRTSRKWNERVQQVKLRIVDKRGGERNRELIIKMKKYPEERTRSIVFFLAPPDVKNVGMLQWADPKGTDQQWLYLPEMQRVRQISGGAKRESFVGTDFNYEDLAIIAQILDWSDSEARTRLLRDEVIDQLSYHVIEFVPTGKDLGYGRVLIWLSPEDVIIRRFEMYDKNGQLQKTLTTGDFRTVGVIPTPFHMEMSNLAAGSHTVVDFTDVKYDTGLDDDVFSQRALERGP